MSAVGQAMRQRTDELAAYRSATDEPPTASTSSSLVEMSLLLGQQPTIGVTPGCRKFHEGTRRAATCANSELVAATDDVIRHATSAVSATCVPGCNTAFSRLARIGYRGFIAVGETGLILACAGECDCPLKAVETVSRVSGAAHRLITGLWRNERNWSRRTAPPGGLVPYGKTEPAG